MILLFKFKTPGWPAGLRAIFRFLPLMLLTATLWQPLHVSANTDAFGVEVAVANRSDAEQKAAFQAGMRRVLLNNSGDKTILNRDDIRAAIREAEAYVDSFSYRTPAPGTVISRDTPLTNEVRQSGRATQLMPIRFDRIRLRELIDKRKSAEPESSDDAPVGDPFAGIATALMWLLIADDTRDIRISEASAENVRDRAREIAGADGVSLVFPIGDDEDLASVTTEDLQIADLARIQAASERYRHDAILSGQLFRDGALGWRGVWTRLAGEQQESTEIVSKNLDQALQDGLAFLTSRDGVDESYRYGGGGASETEALVWIRSVNSTSAYARVMNFLNTVPSISAVYPKEVNNSGMVFAVVPVSAVSAINSAAATQNWLQRTAPPADASETQLGLNADLSLVYQP